MQLNQSSNGFNMKSMSRILRIFSPVHCKQG